jgi:hypothetical protein
MVRSIELCYNIPLDYRMTGYPWMGRVGYLPAYLERRYGFHTHVVIWTYNLMGP